jgi:hypothetical protein
LITGEVRSQIDRIWDAFWSGGISNPLEVIEQITYLLFLRRLDDLRSQAQRQNRQSNNFRSWKHNSGNGTISSRPSSQTEPLWMRN